MGVFNASALVVTWTTLTAAHAENRLPMSAVAASPARIAHGQIWLLFTSGLLVQRPIVLSLVSFIVLAVIVVAVCGPKLLWIVMIIGHVFSTLITYGLLAGARLIDPNAYAYLLHAPDYGVSAIAAAWLGLVACTAWERRGASLGGKAAVVLSCVAVALFAWMAERHVQRHLTFLDSEHAFAFLLGVLAVRNPWIFALSTRRTFSRKTPLPDA